MTDKTKCDDCALAKWKRTTAGRLHPDKTGKCGWEYPEIRLPNSRYFLSGVTPCGGSIHRGHTYATECPQYVERSAP